MNIAEKTLQLKQDFDDVYEAGKELGKKSQYDEFWDAYQNNGERKNYNYAFQSLCWTDETYNPKYPIVASSATNIFVSNTNITDTKVPIDLRGCRINNTFSYSGLVTIREIIVDESTRISEPPNGFSGLYNLVNIKFTGIWSCGNIPEFAYSHYLSKESITSIVNALCPNASGYTVTFSKRAKEAAFTENEWSALIATKPNWTFSLYSQG